MEITTIENQRLLAKMLPEKLEIWCNELCYTEQGLKADTNNDQRKTIFVLSTEILSLCAEIEEGLVEQEMCEYNNYFCDLWDDSNEACTYQRFLIRLTPNQRIPALAKVKGVFEKTAVELIRESREEWDAEK